MCDYFKYFFSNFIFFYSLVVNICKFRSYEHSELQVQAQTVHVKTNNEVDS